MADLPVGDNRLMERATKQRAAIRKAIEDAGRPLSPTEVLVGAQGAVPGLSLATVYRNLKLMLSEHEVALVNLPGESPRYESSHHAHHHHFQCTRCQRVFDIHECPGDMSALVPKDFSVERHEITLYGRCKDCKPNTASRASRQNMVRTARA